MRTNNNRSRSQEPGLRIDRTRNMAFKIQSVGVIGAGQMGNGIAHVCALAGYSVMLNDVSADRIKAGIATINGNMTRQVAQEADQRGRPQGRARAHQAGGEIRRLGDCDLVIETATEKEEVKRKIFSDSVRVAEAGRDRRHQHLVDLDHAAGLLDRPAGALHRHSFHESGAADGAGRGDPRHRHRRRHLRDAARNSSPSSARPSRCRRISRPSSSTASCCR